ncbi:MAG: STAS domain-containing protein [Betaproteobacteria bacterium]|nr:STAS domain-containing protein [Betaproteobacteria bacterium]
MAQALPSDEDLTVLRDRLVEEVGRQRAQGVIIDVTGLDVMDSFSARTLRDLAQMVRMRGAETVMVGIQPEVAFSMVQLGLRLEGVSTALDLEDGIAYLDGKRRLQKSSVK